MRIWASANQKGGVGKTTTAVCLAGWLVRSGRRTLMVDLDPQGSLTTWFGLDPDRVVRGVHSLFEAHGTAVPPPLAALAARTGVAGLSLLPASTSLAALERRLGGREGAGRVLGTALARWRGCFDHVILDCPPALGLLMVNALGCCERVIVPVQTEPLALAGLARLRRTLEMICRSRGRSLPHVVVPTLYDRRTRAARASLHWLEMHAGAVLWPGVIPVDTQLREASRRGVPPPIAAPASRGARAYAALLEWLIALDERHDPARRAG